MQSNIVDAEHGPASGRLSSYIHFVVAVFDRIRMDCGHSDVDAGRTSQMDSMGFIAQFYTSIGNYCVHNYPTVFGCPSECGKEHVFSLLCRLSFSIFRILFDLFSIFRHFVV